MRQVYWLATYTWDVLQYAVLCSLVMAVFVAYGGGATRTFLASHSTATATFLLLWCYGLAAIPQVGVRAQLTRRRRQLRAYEPGPADVRSKQ